ncbi:hypothetical protein [Micromonospora sp. LOL_023]|uniref:hypothetical protein n=1 Tax=Micromonospora sp. LOL_023 TaxID=3345418 RepID=UPI003A8B1DB8
MWTAPARGGRPRELGTGEWIWQEGVKMMHDGWSGDRVLVLVRALMFAADGGQS